MTRNQENIRSMWLSMLAVLLKYTTVWTPRVPFARQVNLLRLASTGIDNPAIRQGQNDKGIAEDKAQLEFVAATLADNLGDMIQAYALDQGDMELYRKMTFSASNIINLADTISKDKMNEIHTKGASLGMPVLEAYGMVATDLPALRAAIEAFAARLSDPRDAIVERGSATKTIAQVVREGQAARFSLLKQITSFGVANPVFEQELRQAAIIVDLRGRGDGTPVVPVV